MSCTVGVGLQELEFLKGKGKSRGMEPVMKESKNIVEISAVFWISEVVEMKSATDYRLGDFFFGKKSKFSSKNLMWRARARGGNFPPKITDFFTIYERFLWKVTNFLGDDIFPCFFLIIHFKFILSFYFWLLFIFISLILFLKIIITSLLIFFLYLSFPFYLILYVFILKY